MRKKQRFKELAVGELLSSLTQYACMSYLQVGYTKKSSFTQKVFPSSYNP